MWTRAVICAILKFMLLTWASRCCEIMRFLGVDPGLKGAIAVCDTRARPWAITVRDMPTHELTVNGSKRKRLDGHALARAVLELHKDAVDTIVIIEDVHSMPKQGVASSFTFGKVAGAIEQCFIDHSIPIRLVQPSAWKRILAVTADKDSSRQRASQLFPTYSHLWPKRSHDGRAEAVLLAYYGAKAHEAIFT